MNKPTYLVTGAAGFIGSRFVESCQAKGIATISVDSLPHFDSRTEHRKVEFGKRVERSKLWAFLDQTAPSLRAIIHLGACTNTMELDQAFLKKQNLEYSISLWNFATKQKIPFVYASSAATYGDGALGYDDDESILEKLKPLNPYGDSKLRFDIWAKEQAAQGMHPPRWSGFKFFNVYGFGERHKNKMASVVLHAYDQIKKDGKVKLFKSHKTGIADGDQKRDFIAVEDVLSVLHFALEKPIGRGIYNLGTGQAQTYRALVSAVFKYLKQKEIIEFVDTPLELRERYQYFTQAKMDRLRAQGYASAFLSLEEGVASYLKKLV